MTKDQQPNLVVLFENYSVLSFIKIKDVPKEARLLLVVRHCKSTNHSTFSTAFMVATYNKGVVCNNS